MADCGQKTLSTQCYVGPITALSVCEGVLISGCGSEISLFDLSTCKLRKRATVFVAAIVHGIKQGPITEDEILLCVYGGKQACVVSLNRQHDKELYEITCRSEVLKTKDWILDAHWLQDQQKSNCICLATAHNTSFVWHWSSGEIKYRRECTEKCIIYCSHFIGNSLETLMFAAGTVFNEVVLWPVGCGTQQDAEKQPVDIMHTFSGHKGVIFSITYHYKLRRLCSVSDDRSIRMWQLHFPDWAAEEEVPSVPAWQGMNDQLMFSLYGHAARVWDVVLMSESFASVGEDATCFVWDYSGKIMQKFKGHTGKSIWSLAASPDETFVVTGGGDASIRLWDLNQSSRSLTVSSFIQFQDKCQEDDFPRTVNLLMLDIVLIMMNSGSLFAYNVTEQTFQQIFSDPTFKSYSVSSVHPNQSLLAVGNIMGMVRIVFYKADKAYYEMLDVKLYEGKVLCLVWVDTEHLLCSGPDGLILLLGVTRNGPSEVSVKIVQKLHLPMSKHRWMTGASWVASLDANFLVCGDKDGSLFLYAMNEDKECEPSQKFYRVHGKTGVTSVCECRGHIYTTGRDGFYRQWEMQDGRLVQLHGYKVLKGLEWIDHLEWHDGDLQVYGFFSSQFVVWSVTYNQQLLSVKCGGGHRSWSCLCQDGVSRFVYLKAGQVSLVDSSCQEKQRLVQPVLHGREVCDVKFVPSQNDQLFPVVCSASEDTTINIICFENKNGLTVRKPLVTLKGHLSSVRALALCSLTEYSPTRITDHLEKKVLLFSGGGRAEIRAWRLHISKQNLGNGLCKGKEGSVSGSCKKKTSEADKGVPSINKKLTENLESKAIRESSDNEFNSRRTVLYEVQAGGNEPPNTSLVCRHEHLCTHFLGESRHKQRFGPWKTRKLRLDPETRVMSLAVSQLQELGVAEDKPTAAGAYLLSVAGSDGHLRILLFKETSSDFSQLAVSFHHKCCVLKTVHYIHKTEQNQIQAFALTSSTRGDIVLWDLSKLVSDRLPKTKPFDQSKVTDEEEPRKELLSGDEDGHDYIDFTKPISNDQIGAIDPEQDMQPTLCLTAHQSGVNSLHVLQHSESNAIVVSGGDDNAITVYQLHISGSIVTVHAKGSQVNAHAAQITGIWLINPSVLVSVSIDQRVSIWQLDFQEGEIMLNMIGCKYIDIADVSALDVCIIRGQVHLCVAGEGLCLLNLEDRVRES